MIIHTNYECQCCGMIFESENECDKHEASCNPIITFTCDKCGREISWNERNSNYLIEENQCHYVNLGTPGYGSKFDRCNVAFNLCDNCLCEFVLSLKKECYDKIFG